jgi:hypothetical protein
VTRADFAVAALIAVLVFAFSGSSHAAKLSE